MISSIHRKLAIRLTAGALAISAALGGGVFFFEMEKVDDGIVDRALQESRTFADRHSNLLDSQDEAPLLQTALDNFISDSNRDRSGHFILAEVYDPDTKRLAESGGDKEVEKAFDRSGHGFHAKDVWYDKKLLGKRVFIQAVVPLTAPDGASLGFFESIYQVSPEALAEVRSQVGGSVLLVIAAVLGTAALLYPIILGLNRSLVGLSSQLLQANIDMLEVLGGAIAKRDSDTHVHNFRVTLYSIRLAEAVNRPAAAIRELIKGAFLHDVGKIAISDAILLKPGKLTQDEFAVMKTHVEHGLDIVNRSDWLTEAAEIVRSHHEKFDGSGYMQGLKGKEIPLNARIFAIADVFDALTSRRPYKEPMSFNKTMAILHEGSGNHFDPDLIAAFDRIAPALHQQYGGREDVGVEQDAQALTRKYFHGMA